MKIRFFNKSGVALLTSAILLSSTACASKDTTINLNLPDANFTSTANIEEDSNLSYEVCPAVIATTDLNVFYEPDKDSIVMGMVTPGYKFEKIEDCGDWYEVEYYGQMAYVPKRFTIEDYMVKGKPSRVLFSDNKVYLTEKETGNKHILNPYEVIYVYKDLGDKLLVYSNGYLGFIDNNNYFELTGTYAIVDISDQRIDLYNDTKQLYYSPVTTGKKGDDTPIGYYDIYADFHEDYCPSCNSKIDDAYLFGDGLGFHDARDRYTFGDSSFYTSGTNGCIDMPMSTGFILNNLIQENQDQPAILIKQ